MAALNVLIALEKKSYFQQSPPAGWRLNPATNKTTCEDNSVTVMSQDKTIEGRNTCFEVGTLEELENVKKIVSSKPILTVARCGKSYDDGRGRRGSEDMSTEDSTRHSTHMEDYIVLVNTAHPQIAEQFNKAYEQAETFIRQNKKFRITVALSESVRIWFMNNVPINGEVKSSTWATNCDIHLVNGIKEPTFADRCFTCEQPIMIFFWAICFPFFLLCALPYIIYKKCILGLEETKVGQPVPVTFHEGPFQNGFNLMNLLYAPGTVITTVTQYPNTPYGQPRPYTQQPPAYPPAGGYYPQGYQQSYPGQQPNYQGQQPTY